MLILAREVDQEVTLSGGIRIKILSIGLNKVRLGFFAPDDVEIYRTETAEQREREMELDGHLRLIPDESQRAAA